MKLRLSEIVKKPYMSGSKVLVAAENLSSTVSSVAIFEGIENTKTGENSLVIASFDVLRAYNRAEWHALLEYYKSSDVSAICIKNSQKYNLSAFAEAAGKAGISVILLSPDSTISAVIRGLEFDILSVDGYDFSSTYEDNFFQELIFTENDKATVLKHARMMGIRVNEYVCSIIIKPTVQTDLSGLIERSREVLGSNSFSITRNGTVLIIARATISYSETEMYFRDLAKRLFDKLASYYGPLSLAIGVGHTYENIWDIRKSYYDAKTALIMELSAKNTKHLRFYDDLGIYKMLFNVRNREDLYSLRDRTSSLLKQYDEERHTEYYATIEAYIAGFFSIQKTADSLSARYNTIKYRLDKIKEIFGWDLYSIEDCLLLAVALRADRYLQEEQ